MMVEMGPDRLHHAAWQYLDPTHPGYEKDGKWEAAARDYYIRLDVQIGELIDRAGAEEVLIVSDHGAKAMRGGFALNDFLIDKGYLVLRDEKPSSPTALDKLDVDWSKTRAWAVGGYYGRVFLNLQGREPAGIVSPWRLGEELAALKQLIEDAVPNSRVLRPVDRYLVDRGKPPDLMAYLNDLDLRAFGTVGHPKLFVEEDDRGIDSCNHDWEGIIVSSSKRELPRQICGVYDFIRGHFA